jgi:hypothetical protein
MTETGESPTAGEFSLRQRLFGAFAFLILIGALTYLSVKLAQFALILSDLSLWVRGPMFALSGLLMFGALRLAWSPLSRKWKTGRFLLTRAESAAKQAEYRAKMGAGKPFWPQAGFWILPLGFIAFFLGLGILAIVAATSICGCNDKHSYWLAILLWLLAATLLFIPGWFFYKAIRRKLKSGSFLPSEEELAAARARCRKPKKLWQRITTAALWWFVAIIWTDMAIGRPHHWSSAWIVVGISSLTALIWTWQIFRPSPPQCSPSILPDEPQKPPEAPSS